jgi:hypothetical protein
MKRVVDLSDRCTTSMTALLIGLRSTTWWTANASVSFVTVTSLIEGVEHSTAFF